MQQCDEKLDTYIKFYFILKCIGSKLQNIDQKNTLLFNIARGENLETHLRSKTQLTSSYSRQLF